MKSRSDKILFFSENKELILYLKNKGFLLKKINNFIDIDFNQFDILICDDKLVSLDKIKKNIGIIKIPIIIIIDDYKDVNKYKDYYKYGIKDFFLNDKNNFNYLAVLIKKNISNEKETNNLLNSENNYKMIFENATEGITIIQNGLIKFANPYLFKMIKYSKKDVIGKPFIKFVYSEDVIKAKEIYLKRIFGEGDNIVNQLRFYDKNKNILWFNASGVKINWENKIAILYFLNDATSSKKMQTELLYSEENLKALLNATNDLAFLLDTNGDILAINKIARERIGKGKNFFKITPKYLLKMRKSISDQLTVSKNIFSYIEEHKERIYRINVYPILDEKRNIKRLAIYANDITAYRKAEIELKNNEEKFRALIENAQDGIIIIDKIGKIKFVSPTVKKIIGYKPEDIIGKNAFSFIHPLDYKKVFTGFMKSLSDHAYKDLIEFKIMNKNGNWRMVEGIGINLFKNKIINGMVVTFRDITERKIAQTELNIYKYIVSSSNDQILFINSNYIVLASNTSLFKAFDIRKENIIGFSISKVFGENDFRDYLKDYCDQCFSGSEINFERWYHYPKLGNRYMNFSLYPYYDNNYIVGIVINIRDLTERIEMESDIIDLREKEQQNIGIELHDGLSHNLLGIALKSRILGDKLKKILIKEELDAREIEHLINNSINETKKLASGLFHSDLEETDLRALLNNVKRDIESKHNLGCKIDIGDDVSITDIKTITQFYNIIQESVRNCVKHAKANNFFIKIYYENSFLCLDIKDDGIGIIFDNLNKNGMGLNIMKYRARMIGGTLNVQRGKDNGTEIKCILRNN